MSLRTTIGLAPDLEVTCRSCGGIGVDFRVHPRFIQALRYDWRPRLRGSRDFAQRPVTATLCAEYPLARLATQWSAHGHDLFGDHPLIEMCGRCNGMGRLVRRRQ